MEILSNPIVAVFIASGLPAYVGMAFLVSGIKSLLKSRKVLEGLRTMTTAKVVDLAEHRYSYRDKRTRRTITKTRLAPVFEFTASEKTYRLESPFYADPEKCSIGDLKDIYYDASDPTQFRLVSSPVHHDGVDAIIMAIACFILAFFIARGICFR